MRSADPFDQFDGPDPPDGKWHVDGWRFFGWVTGENYLTPEHRGWLDEPRCPPWRPVYVRDRQSDDADVEPF